MYEEEGNTMTELLELFEEQKYKELQLAVTIAFRAHEGLMREDGTHYIFHVLAVMYNVPNDNIDAKIVAALHDVLEESPDLTDYIYTNFRPHIAEAVNKLTRNSITPYEEYINGLKDNPLAKIVKIADLRHNSDTLYHIKDPMRRQRLHDRYSHALWVLSKQ